jgi:hypothetical protein
MNHHFNKPLNTKQKMTNEETKIIDNAIENLAKAHNELAKTKMDMETYTPISSILAQVKIDLFKLVKKQKY